LPFQLHNTLGSAVLEMHLLDLPLELLQLTVHYSVAARSLHRALRLQLVSRLFHKLVWEEIVHSRLLDELFPESTSAWAEHYIYDQSSYTQCNVLRRYLTDRIVMRPDSCAAPGCPERQLRDFVTAFSGLVKDECDDDAQRKIITAVYSVWDEQNTTGYTQRCAALIRSRSNHETHGNFILMGPGELHWRRPSPERVKGTPVDDNFKFSWDDKQEENRTLLDMAIYLGRIDLVRQILGTYDHEIYDYQLEMASKHSGLAMLRLLLRHGDKPTDRQSLIARYNPFLWSTILYLAAVVGFADLFSFAADLAGPLDFERLRTCGLGNVPEFLSGLAATRSPVILARGCAIYGLGTDASNLPCGRKLSHKGLHRRVHTTAEDGGLDMMRYLLKCAGSDAADVLNTPTSGRKPLSKIDGYDKYGVPMEDYWRPLVRAVERNDVEMVRLMLEHGADPNFFAVETALGMAAKKGFFRIAEMLIGHGADVNVSMPPPVVLAMHAEDEKMFRLLRDHGASLEEPEQGPWAMAYVESNGLDSMKDLLVNEGVETGTWFSYVPTEREAGAHMLYKHAHLGFH
jgi:hypothetical protein